MISKLFFALIVSLTCLRLSILNAQQTSLQDLYNREVISYGRKLIVNDTLIRFRDFKLLLQKYPEPQAEYLEYRKDQTVANIFGIPGAILLVVFATNTFENDDIRNIAGIGGIGLLVVGGIFSGKARDHMQRSVWLYNRDVLLRNY